VFPPFGSDKPAHGNHVARLAADLRDLLSSRLDLQNVTLVGASMYSISPSTSTLRTRSPFHGSGSSDSG